jgi:hypothetical protein
MLRRMLLPAADSPYCLMLLLLCLPMPCRLVPSTAVLTFAQHLPSRGSRRSN